MNWRSLIRRGHRWLALLIGLQLLLWALSGAYMVSVPIGIIHGNHLVASASETDPPPPNVRLAIPSLAQQYPASHEIRLQRWQQRWVYRIQNDQGWQMLDAQTGARLSPISDNTARQIAIQAYAGDGGISSVTAIREEPQAPPELHPRHLPVWRVDFNDLLNTSLYISMERGELVTKRFDAWRWFDFLWMLHIMDYQARENFHNPLLQIASAIALLLFFSGCGLLYIRLRRRATTRMGA